MKNYEVMLAINPQLEDKEVTSLLEKIKKTISKEKGEVTSVNKWGTRKLSHEIKKFTEANYIVIKFSVDETSIFELERVFKLEEKIIRYLLTVQQKNIPTKKKKK
ncbi:MAG: 30S ribosomal protein S6 [Candidatus Caldatribacteriota bacterium]|nr:30S ribosomal protein S6 [Candidatus Caldatribacteriota bacterium]